MAWSRLQSASSTVAGGNGTVTFATANLSSGTKIICVIAVSAATGGTDEMTSVKDGAGNTLTQLAVVSNAANASWLYLYAVDTPAGDVGTKPTLTATWNTAAVANFGLTMLVQEVSGLAAGNTSAMLDGTAGQANGNSTGPATSGSYSSTASNEYLVAAYGDAGDAVTVSNSAGYTPDTNNVNASNSASLFFDYKNSGNTAESASFTLSGTAHWDTLLVAFKIAASTPTAGPPLRAGPLPNFPATVVTSAGWRNAGHSR